MQSSGVKFAKGTLASMRHASEASADFGKPLVYKKPSCGGLKFATRVGI
jgi:hypothetical protein